MADDAPPPMQSTSVVIAYPSPLERRQRLEAAAAAAARRRRREPASAHAGGATTVVVVAAALSLCACACAAALEISRRRRDSNKQQLDRRRKKTKNNPTPNPTPPPLLARAADPHLPPELAAAVPPATLRPLRALLEAVYTLRGWRGGGYHYERAWERALDKAQGAERGGWETQFDARRQGVVTRRTLRGLARCLDEEFFGGALHGLLMRRLFEEEEEVEGADITAAKKKKKRTTTERAAARAAAAVVAAAAERGGGALDQDNDDDDADQEADEERSNREIEQAALAQMLGLPGARSRMRGRRDDTDNANAPTGRNRPRRRGHQPWRHQQPLTYTADPLHWPPSTYVAAYSSDHHTIRVSTRAWALKLGLVSKERPLNCEGWRAESLLSALAHSLAHELVHALVASCFPRMELEDRSYLGDDGTRHGPAFALLNRAIFGHTEPDALEWVR